ncbi:MAG: AIPR family protein [Acidobacteria bacterium]|nr:AIPR family protein [Acidobacteriota bacterium]
MENWSVILTPHKAVYGQISAAALAKLVSLHGTALFERNIRYYLGSVGLNTAIEKTVRSRPADLFYLNNGLTAVADKIINASSTMARCTFELRNASIVNGAQTAGAINSAAISGAISPDAKVLITIIEVGSDEDNMAFRITNARNHQTVVRGVDFAALDPQQERLRRELAVAGIKYYYRPSAEALTTRAGAFTLEEAAIALACFSFPVLNGIEVARWAYRNPDNAISFIVTAKKEVGRLWDRESALYKKLFASTLSGLRMYRMVGIYRFIDQILAASEQSEREYQRRMFFRHGRYFVMTFVAHRARRIVDRPELILSEEDKTILSRLTNELSELIYAESEPLQGVKGYRAIFSNLADAQPLADGARERLKQQDDAAAAAVDAGSGTPSSTATI